MFNGSRIFYIYISILSEEEKRAQSPSYQLWLDEQEKLELFREEEENRLRKEQNERWLHEEALAQERWEKQQRRLERLKVEKAKQEVNNFRLFRF